MNYQSLCWLCSLVATISSFCTFFVPFLHLCQTDRNRSNPDQGSSSFKRNYFSYSKPGEKKLKQIKRNWEVPMSDQIGSDFIHLHYLYFHRLIPQFQKAEIMWNNEHTNSSILKNYILGSIYFIFTIWQLNTLI